MNYLVEQCLKEAFSLKESKQDEQRLIDYVGQDIANKFLTLKDKLKSPYNDIYYWLKKNKQELVDYLDNYQSNREKDKQAKEEGAIYLGENDKYKVYEITSHQASCLYGKGTTWCITMEDASYYNSYIKKGARFFFFLGKDEKYALEYYPKTGLYRIYNKNDVVVYNVDLPFNLLPKDVKLNDSSSVQARIALYFDVGLNDVDIDDDSDRVYIKGYGSYIMYYRDAAANMVSDWILNWNADEINDDADLDDEVERILDEYGGLDNYFTDMMYDGEIIKNDYTDARDDDVFLLPT